MARYASPWTYSKTDPRNPFSGEIRAASGEIMVVRTVMNEDDESVLRKMAAAPDLIDALEAAINLTLDDEDPAHRAFLERALAAIAKAK